MSTTRMEKIVPKDRVPFPITIMYGLWTSRKSQDCRGRGILFRGRVLLRLPHTQEGEEGSHTISTVGTTQLGLQGRVTFDVPGT